MSFSMYPMLIDGQKVESAQGFEVQNPANGKTIARVSELQSDQVPKVLSSAQKGFELWSSKTPREREVIILKYAELLESNRERLVNLLIEETGKTQEIADYDFGMLITCLHYFVEEVKRLDVPVLHDPDGRFLHYTQRQPLGVVVGMLAWNFPLLNVGYKLGPVLASGCSAIIKPAALTPLSTLEATYLLKEAGVPDGVVNVVTSTDHDVVAPILQSKIPAMVTMIGSTRGGLEVMKNACTSIKSFSVELGGNAPVLVYADADVEKAASKIVDLKFANGGQVCVSPNRVYVHESIHEHFVKLVIAKAQAATMAPLISDKERQRVLALVAEATAEGATLETGGKTGGEEGFFMEATVLSGMKQTHRLKDTEIFGPILPIYVFGDDDDEIAMANDVVDGLAAYVFTQNLQRGLKAARDIQAGSVCINEPHYSIQLPHGGLKQSGVGKDCSKYSLEEYLTLKRVSVMLED